MDSKTVLKRLAQAGWYEIKQRSGTSHRQLKHPDKPGRVTVKHPDKDIPPGTLRSIEKQSGVRLS